MKALLFALSFFLLAFRSPAQVQGLKEQALESFRRERYDEAVALMERAAEADPTDAESWYYLGFFNHYRAYDSRPLKGYDLSYSERVFSYLDRALELDPSLGDARYFYGAECSANAFHAMRERDLERLRHFYEKAFLKGAYPPWLLELGRNMLDGCDRDAILFAGGNGDFDVCSYLQLHEGYRRDVSVLPVGYTDRPWYAGYLRDGLEGAQRPLALSLSDEQILEMRPFKWDTLEVRIPVSEALREEFSLPEDAVLAWTVAPDFASERLNGKLNDEKARPRTYLSPQRAVMLQIVEDNYASRPIFFSRMGNPFIFAGLDRFFSHGGLVSRLLPFPTAGTAHETDVPRLERLLRADRLKEVRSVATTDIPRISGCLFVYTEALARLAAYYRKAGRKEDLRALAGLYRRYLMPVLSSGREDALLEELEQASGS